MFKYLEVLAKEPEVNNQTLTKAGKQKDKPGFADKSELLKTIKMIADDCSDEDGWAYLGEVGTRLNKRYPDFDVRNYGHSKLTPLILSLKAFDIQSQKTSNPRVTQYYIKNKK
jgi:Fe-S-cluster formation regulator IscX/YfhJ